VRKQSGGNTVAVAEAVRERIEELEGTLPDGYAVDVLRDESASIRTGTEGVKEHLVVGALLAALVVFAFLGSFRSTVIAALAIPTSIVGTFALMALMGYTLNTITLLALALAVGIVIDDAIVVLENIYRFVEEKGMSPAAAAVAGTKDIGLAVLATTFSLIAVFMPVAFLAGIPGRFLSSFGVTMSFAIAVSLFVSFSLTPMLASRWLKAKPHGAPPTFGERVVNVFYRPVERGYMAILRFAMRRRWVIVLLCFLTLAALPLLASVAKKGFLPVDDRAQFEVTIRAPEGTSIAATGIIGERIAAEIRAMPEVSLTLVTTGANDQGEDNVSQVYVRLLDPKDRSATQDQLMDRVRNDVLAHQDANLQLTASLISDIGGTGNSNARIQYNLTGPDLDKLQEYADKIVVELKKVKGAVDVSSSFVAGKPEVALRVDRARAADLGISVLDVASTLQMMVSGVDVGRYAEGGKQYTIRMRAAPEFRNDPAVLGLIPVLSPKAGLVALTDLVSPADGTGPATINRLNRMRNVTISANAAPGVGDNIIQDAIVKIAAEMKMPPEYQVSPAGQAKIMKETAQAVLLGFALAFVFMYLILAAQFESWLHPFTILLSLPLTLPFAVLSIVLTGQALDMFSVLGIFVLFGIVKKNAILQIDHTNHLRAEGMPRLEAILQANKDRLRPILMTTVAFVAGMIPLVTSKGIGSGFNQATAGVVVGGQTFSLLLTLVATPVAYSLFDDVLIRVRAWMLRLGLTQPAAEPLEPGVTEEHG
jgi:multidrug efflux pump subunit AcrB